MRQIVVGYAGASVLLLALQGCLKNAPPVEVFRVASPDHKVDAILASGGGGATVGRVTKIYVVPAGGKLDDDEPAFVADKVKNIKVVWRKNRFLEIQYDRARIFSFTNFWHDSKVDNFSYLVELRLLPTQAQSLP